MKVNLLQRVYGESKVSARMCLSLAFRLLMGWSLNVMLTNIYLCQVIVCFLICETSGGMTVPETRTGTATSTFGPRTRNSANTSGYICDNLRRSMTFSGGPGEFERRPADGRFQVSMDKYGELHLFVVETGQTIQEITADEENEHNVVLFCAFCWQSAPARLRARRKNV